MPKASKRSYSRYSRRAAQLLGGLIRSGRKEGKITATQMAERAGISRGLLQRIEKGDLKCEIGATFEVAALLGIKLFDLDERELNVRLHHTKEKLALLPKAIRKTTKKVSDDF
jgi:DNA-binding XRE family transcriptional regulator